MQTARLDHLVLTVRNVTQTIAFYETVLGMRPRQFGDGRWALHFGRNKINLHQYQQEFEPKAAQPTPGSADLCFITSTPLAEVMAHLREQDVALVESIVPRTGASGPITSIYIRDPDGNLIELSNYAPNASGNST